MVTTNTSGRLYRIVRFHHAVQMFQRGEMHLSHPSVWSDPYEVRLNHAKSGSIFGQCWCTKGVSDAMWRIYSPDHLGVRLSTSTKKLKQALESAANARKYHLKVSKVEYLTSHDLDIRLRAIRDDLKAEYKVRRAVDAFFLKRKAFEHESEYRAVIYCPDVEQNEIVSGIKVEIDAYKLVDSVLLDPRAPDELVDALSFYFKDKLRYKRRVGRSVLYQAPTPLYVRDEDEEAA